MPEKRMIRYFFMNLLCIIFPLMVTGFIVTQKLVIQMHQEEERKLFAQMEEIVSTLDSNFQDFQVKSIALFENNEFSSSHVVLDSNAARTAIRLLNSLKQFDSEADEIALCYGDGDIYHAAGMVRQDTYFLNTLNCQKESARVGGSVLESRAFEALVLYKQSGGGYLMYHMPRGADHKGYERSMEVFISFSRLAKLLSNCVESTDVVLELNIGGEKIYFHNTDNGCEYVSWSAAEILLESHKSELGERTVLSTGIGVRLLFDMNRQLAEFYKMRNIYIMLMVLGACLSLIMSLIISKRRHTSMEALISSIREKIVKKDTSKRWPQNEFDYIQSVLDEAIVENNEVRMNARKYREMLFKQVCMMIMHGLLRETDEIRTVLKICGIELFEEYYFLCGVRVKNKEALEQIERYLQAEIHCVYQEQGIIGIVILCELPCMDFDMGKRRDVAERFCKVMEEENITCGQIVMSQVYAQISMVNYGYLQVLSILKNLPESSTDNICWEEWIQKEGQHAIKFGNDDLRSFREAITRKNEQQACLLLKRILKQNTVSQTQSDEMRYMRYMLVQELLLEIRTADDVAENQELLSEITAIDIDKDGDFEANIKSVLHKYCYGKEKTDEADEIIRFVEENYLEYDFSLEKVAEHAGISKGQMSKLFRAKTGLSYIDYITHLRMEKAKELLGQTDRSIKDIFMTVGYTDVTSASRKFKAYYGMNPSVYREQVKEQRG